jgi:glutamate-1-semialdehyde 2,1-aminomutase
MFSLKFSDAANFRKFYPLMLDKGIYFAQSEFEANFLSFAHTKKDILKTADAVKSALERI